MLSFAQFLEESIADNRIVKNPSLDAVRNLAKRFKEKYGENLRYAIRKDGSTVAGRSGLYTHWHLAGDEDPSEVHHIEGGVHYEHGEYKFSAVDQHNNYRDETGRHPVEHPIVARMRSKMKLDNTLFESKEHKKHHKKKKHKKEKPKEGKVRGFLKKLGKALSKGGSKTGGAFRSTVAVRKKL